MRPLRILLIEDSPEDAELLALQLRRGGIDPQLTRVASADALRSALQQQEWDLVISDYILPGFGGLEALDLCQAEGLEAPFLIVSGQIGEDLAVAAMKAGADDYLMKDRLGRLVPAIDRALHEAQIRRAHLQASQALRAGEERFRQLAENIGAAFFMFELPETKGPGTLSYVSPAFEKIWGYPAESLFWEPSLWLKAIHPEDIARVQADFARLGRGYFNEEFRIVRMDLGLRWVHLRTFPVRDESGQVYRVAALAEDITERRRTEEQLGVNARHLRETVAQLRAIEEELRRSNSELRQARSDLEQRVQQRTAELIAANEQLHQQFSERKRLESELLEIAENERRRIGFDLHDDLGQKLMGVSLLLKALEKGMTQQHLAEARDIREIATLIQQVINHTHNLARRFSSFEPHGDDLCVLLRKLSGSVRRTFHISCRFRAAGQLEPLPRETMVQLYKIAQEAVNNAIKHGKASLVLLSLAQRPGELILRIKNDGLPYAADREPANRLGLRIMNYRARTIGGVFAIRANGLAGTLVSCTLPLPKDATVTKPLAPAPRPAIQRTTALA